MNKRPQNISPSGAGFDSSEPLDSLLERLSEHGLNFILGEPYWQDLAARGPEIIPALLGRCDGDRPFNLIDLALRRILAVTVGDLRERAAELLGGSLARDTRRGRRLAAIKAFSPAFSDAARHIDPLLAIALDPTDDPEARVVAFTTLTEMHPTGAQAERLVDALDSGHAHGDIHSPLSDAIFQCLRRHARRIPGWRLRRALEPYLTHESTQLRQRAIELIGKFGDLDMIEHLFALPHAEFHRKEILQATAEIGSRPINLVSLRPDAFEAVISRVLKTMGFQDVEPTRYSGDRGVDATCTRLVQGFPAMERERVVVQYKRYAKKPIDKRTLQAFVETYAVHKATYGLFITTSSFTQGADDYAAWHGRLRLISGQTLVAALDEVCKFNRYVIRSPKEVERVNPAGPPVC